MGGWMGVPQLRTVCSQNSQNAPLPLQPASAAACDRGSRRRDRREEGQCPCRRARARCWEEQSSSLSCPDCCICQPQQLFCPLKDRKQKKTSV